MPTESTGSSSGYQEAGPGEKSPSPPRTGRPSGIAAVSRPGPCADNHLDELPPVLLASSSGQEAVRVVLLFSGEGTQRGLDPATSQAPLCLVRRFATADLKS